MRYRPFGKLEFQVLALGYGSMRLPTPGGGSQTDEPQAIRMCQI